MCTLSLIEVNRCEGEQRQLQRLAQIRKDLVDAAQKEMTLMQRYQLATKNMKRQLHALRLHFISVYRPCQTLVPSAPRSRNMSVGAPVFTPALASESSSDSESSPRISSDFEREGSPDAVVVVDSDCEFDCEQSARLAESRKELLGKIVCGRLNVYTPKNGVTRYYINWSKNTYNNVRITPEVLIATFGSLDNLNNSMYLQATISEFGHNLKEHPFGTNVSVVPAPKLSPKKNRRKRRHKKPSLGPTRSNE